MSKYKCPICGKNVNIIYEQEGDINFNTTNLKFDWYICDFCESLSIQPLIDSETLKEFYNDYAPAKGRTFIDDTTRKTAISSRINYIKNNIVKDEFSFLDIGCGNGNMLYNIKHYFPKSKVYGVDYNIQYSRKNLKSLDGVFLFEGGFNSVPDIKFDIISSSQLMEHLNNPIEYIDFIKKHINQNCSIFSDIPNIDSYSYKRYKNKWIHLDTPRHQIHYSEKAMKILFNEFKLEKIEKFGLFEAIEASYVLSMGGNIHDEKEYENLSLDYKTKIEDDKVLYIHTFK